MINNMRHKVNIKIALLLTCMFLSAFGAKISAQSSTVYTIKGVVTDEFGKPLSGVVEVKISFFLISVIKIRRWPSQRRKQSMRNWNPTL